MSIILWFFSQFFGYLLIRRHNMITIYYLFGPIWASFIITWTQRTIFHPTDVTRRSHCDRCYHPLTWWQLLPLLGYLFQRGRCRYCQTPIDPYSTIGELLTGYLWFLLHAQLSMAQLTFLTTSALILATTDYYGQWIDLRWLIGLLFIPPWPYPKFELIIGSIGLTILLITIKKRHWLGSGDLWLFGILLWRRGLLQTAVILLIACSLILVHPKIWQHQPVPFVPSLLIGCLIELSYWNGF